MRPVQAAVPLASVTSMTRLVDEEPSSTADGALIWLDEAPLHVPFVVHRVAYPQGQDDWPQRLEELGFLPGERVTLLMRGWPGGDPIAVRVGHSTFALRRAEAACVQLRALRDQS